MINKGRRALKKILIVALISIFILPLGDILADEEGNPKPDKKQTEWLQYENVKEEDFDVNVGFRYDRKEKGMEVDVTAVATGKGADFRKWEVTDTKLVIGGKTVRPGEYDRFYGKKESIFRWPATFVFGAIGTQYQRYGPACSSGQVCPVGSQGEKVGGVANVIDKAGMTAGLALLTSQAKGEITGQKSTFKLDEDLADEMDKKGNYIKLIVENKEKNIKKRIKIPVKVIPKDDTSMLGGFAQRQSGLEHTGGVQQDGTFTKVYEDE